LFRIEISFLFVGFLAWFFKECAQRGFLIPISSEEFKAMPDGRKHDRHKVFTYFLKSICRGITRTFPCRGITRTFLCFRLLFVLLQTETFSGAWHLFSLALQIRMLSLTACVPFSFFASVTRYFLLLPFSHSNTHTNENFSLFLFDADTCILLSRSHQCTD